MMIMLMSVVPVIADHEVPPLPVELTLTESIVKFSEEYNIPSIWLTNLAKCESSYGTRLVGDGGNARGVYQYWNRTWLWFEKLSGMDLDRESSYDQTKMTSWALANGYGSHWTCSYETGKPRF